MKRKVATRTVPRLVKLRQDKNWTQEQLAKRVGASTAAICLYERGRRLPGLTIASALEEAFGRPAKELFESVEIPA